MAARWPAWPFPALLGHLQSAGSGARPAALDPRRLAPAPTVAPTSPSLRAGTLQVLSGRTCSQQGRGRQG